MSKPTPAAQDRALYKHWHRLGIRAADLDDQRHVNNTEYGVYCEEGRRMFLEPLRQLVKNDRLLIFVARFSIDFLREMEYPGELDVGTTITRVGNSSYTVMQGLFTTAGCHATAEVIMVVASPETRRPMPIPPLLRDHLTQHLNPA